MKRRRLGIGTWRGLDDEALSALEDALSYTTSASANNYGAGWDNDSEGIERQSHNEQVRLLQAITKERDRREAAL